jgi:molybdopterin-synthase adenylyltransferase
MTDLRSGAVDVERHARHIMLKEIGGVGQKRLKAACVGIVGAGGLGAPAALYLAAAGVGTIRLIDDDVVDVSNLQRQVIFQTADVGAGKVDAAARALSALDPAVEIDSRQIRLTAPNARDLLEGCDLVLDGSDSFETRFAVNAACHDVAIPLVSGAVGRWSGQIGVFASGSTKTLPVSERQPCYRCLVPEAPEEAETCAAVGIVGALTGVIGSMMALEAIKVLTGAGMPLIGRLMLFDGLDGVSRTVHVPPDPGCACCGQG